MRPFKLSFFPLMLLIISAVDNNRNLPAIALFGSPLIFYFLIAAIFFLFPVAFIGAELAATHPDKEGIYHWVRHALGEKWGIVATWIQWINTVVWFPTILSFIAGSIAFWINPNLIENKFYMIGMIAFLFWALTFLNLYGIHISTRINTILVVSGTLFPALCLIGLGVFWFFSKESSYLSFNFQDTTPQIFRLDTWVALVAVIGSFLGMELTTVHISHVENPHRNFPLALSVSSIIIWSSMLLGSLTIALILPTETINLAGGIMQVFHLFLHFFHLDWLVPIATFLIVTGSIGGLINWMISPSKGLLFAADHGFLPSYLTKLNQHHVPSRILFIQALLVTFLCTLLVSLPTINGFYWFLSALSTGLYMIMYILMFISFFKLQHNKHWKSIGLASCGIVGAGVTLGLGFVPPPHINIGSPSVYTSMIGIGMIGFISPIFLMFLYKKRQSKCRK